MHLLALTGSLRAQSINTELLRSVALLAPAGTVVRFSELLGALPHFNPDLDREGMTPPAVVVQLRAEIAAADALVISCPEYAHGVAGAFKNLLDWLVSGPELVAKPVAVLRASEGSRFGPESLVETLRTMSARVVTEAPLTIPVNGRRVDAPEIAADAELARAVRSVLTLIAATVSGPQT
jgi:NAD(P)H-dependent FMN reductase